MVSNITDLCEGWWDRGSICYTVEGECCIRRKLRVCLGIVVIPSLIVRVVVIPILVIKLVEARPPHQRSVGVAMHP
jgi:hypothetical protein